MTRIYKHYQLNLRQVGKLAGVFGAEMPDGLVHYYSSRRTHSCLCRRAAAAALEKW